MTELAITLTGPPHSLQISMSIMLREHACDSFAYLLITLRVRRAVALACAMKPGEVNSWPWLTLDRKTGSTIHPGFPGGAKV